MREKMSLMFLSGLIFVRVYNVVVSLYPKRIGIASARLLTCVTE
jgi:hypothetical protein